MDKLMGYKIFDAHPLGYQTKLMRAFLSASPIYFFIAHIAVSLL
jgi:hypothetical protein